MLIHLNKLAIKSTCFFRCNRANTAIEYALIAGLIALVIIGAVTLLGGNLANSYEDTATAVSNS